MKISAMGCDYFNNSWNVFDFIVVVGTILVLIISYLPDVGVDLSAQMTIGRVLRILRVLRIIKRA
jgi:lipoprotein signal peptidase